MELKREFDESLILNLDFNNNNNNNVLDDVANGSVGNGGVDEEVLKGISIYLSLLSYVYV